MQFHKGKGVYIEFNSQIILLATKPVVMFTLFPLVIRHSYPTQLKKRLLVNCDGRRPFEICFRLKKLRLLN